MGEHGISRRDIIKIGVSAAGVVAGGKFISSLTRETRTPIQIVATAQAKLPENSQLEHELSREILSGFGTLDISPNGLMGGRDIGGVGTAMVYLEDESHIVLLTAEHITNFLWKDMKAFFPYGETNHIIDVDATIGTLNGPVPTDSDWWIENVSSHTDFDKGYIHPIRTIIVAKPKGCDRFVTNAAYGPLKALDHEPTKGEEFYTAGFPVDAQRGLVVTKLAYERMTKPDEVKNAGIPLMEFSGVGGEGMSGGAILKRDGTVVALMRGAGTKEGTVLGIPFAQYQPISEVLKVLKP